MQNLGNVDVVVCSSSVCVIRTDLNRAKAPHANLDTAEDESLAKTLRYFSA